MGQTYYNGWLWHDAKGIYIQEIGATTIKVFPKTRQGYLGVLSSCGICEVEPRQAKPNLTFGEIDI